MHRVPSQQRTTISLGGKKRRRRLSNSAVKQITDHLDGVLGVLSPVERRAQQRILHLALVHARELLEEGNAFGLSEKRILALLAVTLISSLVEEMDCQQAKLFLSRLIDHGEAMS